MAFDALGASGAIESPKGRGGTDRSTSAGAGSMAAAESLGAGAGGEAPIEVTIVRLRAMALGACSPISHGEEAGGPNVGPLVLTEVVGLGGNESAATAAEAMREGAAADSAR
jgi:hypothetical protein